MPFLVVILRFGSSAPPRRCHCPHSIQLLAPLHHGTPLLDQQEGSKNSKCVDLGFTLVGGVLAKLACLGWLPPPPSWVGHTHHCPLACPKCGAKTQCGTMMLSVILPQSQNHTPSTASSAHSVGCW